MTTLEEAKKRFTIPGFVEFESGQGGLTRALITTPHSQAHIYLHGAHLTHFQPNGQEPILFLSQTSNYKTDIAIRGGVPICFPWFAGKQDPPPGPFHGFARTEAWDVESVSKSNDNNVKLILKLTSTPERKIWWPFDFVARYIVTVGATLRMSLEVQNTGAQPFKFEEALHTYFKVGDVRRVQVTGLENIEYLDKVQNMKRVNQGPHPVAFTGETDRIYLNTQFTCIAHDPTGGRDIIVEKENSNTTVVWNPWLEKAMHMSDFGKQEWTSMLCIETCNVNAHAVTLNPNQTHTMTAIIRAEKSRS